jgi:hypothetical protein
MTFVNIHGEPVSVTAPPPVTAGKGYPANPGTGPAGKTCRDCAHKRTMSNTGAKSWIKCNVMRAHWTHGAGTDIKAGSPACSAFVDRAASALDQEKAG